VRDVGVTYFDLRVLQGIAACPSKIARAQFSVGPVFGRLIARQAPSISRYHLAKVVPVDRQCDYEGE